MQCKQFIAQCSVRRGGCPFEVNRPHFNKELPNTTISDLFLLMFFKDALTCRRCWLVAMYLAITATMLFCLLWKWSSELTSYSLSISKSTQFSGLLCIWQWLIMISFDNFIIHIAEENLFSVCTLLTHRPNKSQCNNEQNVISGAKKYYHRKATNAFI